MEDLLNPIGVTGSNPNKVDHPMLSNSAVCSNALGI
jgi:hypothetical protein